MSQRTKWIIFTILAAVGFPALLYATELFPDKGHILAFGIALSLWYAGIMIFIPAPGRTIHDKIRDNIYERPEGALCLLVLLDLGTLDLLLSTLTQTSRTISFVLLAVVNIILAVLWNTIFKKFVADE